MPSNRDAHRVRLVHIEERGLMTHDEPERRQARAQNSTSRPTPAPAGAGNTGRTPALALRKLLSEAVKAATSQPEQSKRFQSPTHIRNCIAATTGTQRSDGR